MDISEIRKVLTLCTAALLLLAGRGSAAVYYATENLQSSIDSARPGDTLLVSPGKYPGNIVIHRRLVMRGIGSPVLRGDGRGSVVTIVADSCQLDGFTIEHCGTMLSGEDSGVLVKANHTVVRRNTLRDILFGIYLFSAHHNTVEHNSITGRPELDIGERGGGIHIWDSNYNTFVDNTICDTRDGFYVQNATHSLIERNEAYRVRYGLHYMYADTNVFLANSFHDNVAGAAVMYSRNIRIRHNVFAHNRGFSSFGILFQDCHDMEVDSNVVIDNVIGLFFESTTDNRFFRNLLARNDIALQMFQNSTHNVFSQNNFIDNLSPLGVVGKRTESQWDADARGNYWSSYEGYDLDGDGTGDVPMTIQNVFQYLEGRNGNVRVYLYSPASQALAMSAQAFPIIKISEESDAHPLMTPVDMHGLPAVRMATDLAGRNAAGTSSPAWAVLPLTGFLGLGFLYLHLLRRAS